MNMESKFEIDLIIDDSEKHKQKIKQLEAEKSELEEKNKRISDLEEKYDDLKQIAKRSAEMQVKVMFDERFTPKDATNAYRAAIEKRPELKKKIEKILKG